MTPSDLRPRLSLEAGLYAAIGLLAAALRFYHLGAHPLTDVEAREALAAFRFVQGAEGPLPLSPAYAALTALAFLLYDASDAAARWIPALAGVGLVLTSALWRRELGRTPALVAALLLAVSPTFIAVSRTAGGGSLAVFALALALGAWLQYVGGEDRRWMYLAFGGLGLALASGESAFTGLVVGVLGWATARIAGLRLAIAPSDPIAFRRHLGGALLVGVGVMLGVSTLMLTYRQGLGAAGGAAVRWASGFNPSTGGLPMSLVPLGLLTYEMLAGVFGVAGLVMVWIQKSEARQALGYLLAAAYLFLLVYSGRTPADVQWVLLPLTMLAGIGAAALVRFPQGAENRAALAGHVAVLLILFAFLWLNLAGYTGAAGDQLRTRAVLLLATVGLMGLITGLFGAGWSWAVAALGLGWSTLAALLIYTLGVGWGLNQLRPAAAAELWRPLPTTAGLTRLVSTVQDVSNRHVGSARDISLTVRGDSDSALGWAFRDFPNARFVAELGATVDDPAVIAPEEEQAPALGSAYVGQSFAVAEWLPGGRPAAGDWAGWFVFRRAEVQRAQVILWVRRDVQLKEATARDLRGLAEGGRRVADDGNPEGLVGCHCEARALRAVAISAGVRASPASEIATARDLRGLAEGGRRVADDGNPEGLVGCHCEACARRAVAISGGAAVCPAFEIATRRT